MHKKSITQKEVVETTGIPFYKLEYMIKAGKIPAKFVQQFGSGKKRKYDPKVIEIINGLTE